MKTEGREKHTVFFLSLGDNIRNLCCPWISNGKAYGIYTVVLVAEIFLIHRSSTLKLQDVSASMTP